MSAKFRSIQKLFIICFEIFEATHEGRACYFYRQPQPLPSPPLTNIKLKLKLIPKTQPR